MHPRPVVSIPAEMLTTSPPDLTAVAVHAVRQAERDAVDDRLVELGFPRHLLPVTVGEYRRAATAAGIPAADIEATIAAGTRYLIDIVAGLADEGDHTHHVG